MQQPQAYTEWGVRCVRTIVAFAAVVTLATCGCTSFSLARATVNQSQTATNYRYQATLHALSTVAANRGTLPSFAMLSSGTSTITDTGTVNPVLNWGGSPEVFASGVVGVTAGRAPSLQWTVSPVSDYTQLEAMRCACQFVLDGQAPAFLDQSPILSDPEVDLSLGPHFGVAWRLARLPAQWLGVGCKRDVPKDACYKDCCGDVWVWVTKEGLRGLAEFTLVLQDIATLNVAPSDSTVPAHSAPPVLVTLWVVQNTLAPVELSVSNKDGTLLFADSGHGTASSSIDVTTGQPIVISNDTCSDLKLSVTAKIQGMSDPVKIVEDLTVRKAKNENKTAFVIDAEAFKKGRVESGAALTISIQPEVPLKGSATLSVVDNPYKSIYSPTITTRLDRVVRPECRDLIDERLRDAIGTQREKDVVAIDWSDWMAMTTPYQGQRTSAKPGAASSTAVPLPPSSYRSGPNGATERFEMSPVLNRMHPYEPRFPPSPSQ